MFKGAVRIRSNGHLTEKEFNSRQIAKLEKENNTLLDKLLED